MNKEIKITKKQTKEIVLLENKANTIVSSKIKNDKDAIEATEFLIQLKTKMKTLEDERLTYTAPLNQSLKAINKTFKEITEPLMKAKEIVISNLSKYREIQKEKRLEEEKKLQKRNGNKEIHIEPISSVIESKSGKIRTRKIWKFEVINEKQIPREYLQVNETKTNNAIQNGIRKIKGLKIFQKEGLSVY